MFCRNCGGSLDRDDVFCPDCGAPTAPPAGAVTPPAPQYPPAAEPVAAPAPKKSPLPKILLTAAIVAAVAAGGYFGYGYLSGGGASVGEALVHYAAGRYDLAIEELRPAVDAGLKDREVLAALADCYLRTGDEEASLEVYQLLLEEDDTEGTRQKIDRLREALAKRSQ